MAFLDQIEIQFPTAALDAFARQRMSQPVTIFDSKLVADALPIYWDESEISGSGTGGTYNTNQASFTLDVSNLTAGRRVRQTYRRFNYQAGKSQLGIFTGVLGAPVSGNSKKIGLFDDSNGVFFDSTDSTVGVNVRTFTSGSAVDNRIVQSSWNLDKMDGTGESGITLDFTKTQIFFIDFEWLGVGTVAFGVFVDRQPYYVHFQNHANSLTTVYMSTPNLPIRYEIENDGTGASDTLVQICSTVISEGGQQETGLTLGLNRGATSFQTNNNSNIYPLVALRLNSSYLGSTVKPESFSIVCTTSAAYAWYLILDPTVTGTALSWTALSNSSIDYDITTTNATTLSGGTILKTGVSRETNNGGSGVNNTLVNDFALGSDIAGTAQTLVLAVQRVNGASETFFAGLNWLDQK